MHFTQIESRADSLRLENVGTSAAVVKIVPVALPWEKAPLDAPREVPEWLDIFPISARVAPQVRPIPRPFGNYI